MSFSSGTSSPFGLRPVRYKNGAPWTGAFTWYYAADATRIGRYEPVATTGTAHATTGLKQVQRYTAGSLIIGSAVAFMPAGRFSPTGTQASLAAPSAEYYDYRPASVEMWVGVVDDPDVIFEIQEDGDTTPVAVASIGLNADLITAANCNTTTGLSVAALDSDTVGSDGNLKILGLTQLIDGSNAIGNDYNMFDVMINEHELHEAAAGV